MGIHQQQVYDRAYACADSSYGFPDRKVIGAEKPDGQRILTLGCGTASDVWFLAERNCVFGVDYAYSGLKIAQRHRVEGLQTDLIALPALPFRDSSFDVIVCKDLLEHLLEPLTVAREIARVLKPTGYAVINVPNHFYLPLRVRMLFRGTLRWKSIASDHSRDYEEWNYMHVRFFTYAGYIRFLEQAGLTPCRWFWDFGHLAHYLNPDMWIEPQEWKKEQGIPLSRRARIALRFLKPGWRLFNLLVPRGFRSWLVSLRPGLLCSSFYVQCRRRI